MDRLKNKVAIVTGSTSGIGYIKKNARNDGWENESFDNT